MLGILLKKQFSEIFRSYTYDAKKNKRRSTSSIVFFTVLFVLLIVGFLGGMFTLLSVALCFSLQEAGMGWLYFTMLGLTAILLGAFGSVFNTYAGLYLAKDNDLLLSLPIPVRYIMISRLLSVYLMGLMYSAVVTVPAAIVYLVFSGFAFRTLIGGVFFIFLVSVIVLLLSCALGWVVAKISVKLKNKSFITVFVALVGFAIYYFICFRAQDIITDIIENAAAYGDAMKGKAYPLYVFGRMGEGDPVSLIIVAGIVFLLFALLWYVMSRSFLKIATSSANGTHVKYKETAAHKRSADVALLGKEFGRFTSSPNYMLNCGLGTLILVICGVLLAVKGGELIAVLNDAFDGMLMSAMPVLLFGAIVLLGGMNNMAAPSVSLEAKTLWLMQSLPVTPWQILKAKCSVQLLLSGIPTLFCAVVGAVILPTTAASRIFLVVASLLYVVMFSLFSLFIGLKMPNLTWTNEITVVKQSASVAITLFGGWLLCAAMLVGGFFLSMLFGSTFFLFGISVLMAGLSALLYFYLRYRGAAVFAAL